MNLNYKVDERDFNVDRSNEKFIILEHHKEIDGIDVIISIDSCSRNTK